MRLDDGRFAQRQVGDAHDPAPRTRAKTRIFAVVHRRESLRVLGGLRVRDSGALRLGFWGGVLLVGGVLGDGELAQPDRIREERVARRIAMRARAGRGRRRLQSPELQI